MPLIWLFNFRLWNIQTRKLRCNESILASTFAERSYIRLKYQLVINMISRIFSYIPLEMAVPPMLIWVRCVEFTRKCDFSGFEFRRLLVNHLNKVFYIFCKSDNMLFKFMLVEWRILPSAWLLISRSGKHWIKSHRSTLNSNVPSMKPCGTPKIISDLELYVQLNFILCFLLVKYGCNSSKERISTHNHEF